MRISCIRKDCSLIHPTSDSFHVPYNWYSLIYPLIYNTYLRIEKDNFPGFEARRKICKLGRKRFTSVKIYHCGASLSELHTDVIVQSRIFHA